MPDYCGSLRNPGVFSESHPVQVNLSRPADTACQPVSSSAEPNTLRNEVTDDL